MRTARQAPLSATVVWTIGILAVAVLLTASLIQGTPSSRSGVLQRGGASLQARVSRDCSPSTLTVHVGETSRVRLVAEPSRVGLPVTIPSVRCLITVQRPTLLGPRLCGSLQSVDRLVIVRNALNRGRFTFPAVVVATAAEAQTVAHALCQLGRRAQQTPRVVLSTCPVDVGPQYVLQFFDHDRSVLAVWLDPSGCGETPALQVEQVWSELGHAVGLHDATWLSFLAQ